MSRVIGRGRYATETYPQPSRREAPNPLVWRPDGLGDVRTWAEVMAEVSQSIGPVTIYCPQEDAGVVYIIEPGPPPDAPVVWNMKGSQLVAPLVPHDAIKVQIRRGATLLDLAEISGGIRLQTNKQSIAGGGAVDDPPALTFTPTPGAAVTFAVSRGAEIKNLSSATAPMLLVPATGDEFYLAFSELGTASLEGPYPTVVAPAGALLRVVALSGGLSLDTYQTAGWIGSDPAATVSWVHDGSMAFPPSFWTGYHPFNAGTNVNQPTGQGGGMGPLAYRPIFQDGGPPSVGCMYLATDYAVIAPNGSPIWWDGTDWRDAAGTIVP